MYRLHCRGALIGELMLAWQARHHSDSAPLFSWIHANSNYVLNGGDTLVRITLVSLLFVNLSAHL